MTPPTASALDASLAPSPARPRRTAILFALLTGLVLLLLIPLSDAPPSTPRRVPRDNAALTDAMRPWDTAVYSRMYYASPAGLPTNSGTDVLPLDLGTALSAAGPVGPGDLLWLRGGRYVGNYLSLLDGRADAVIVVAQYPGERAILDGAGASDRPVLRVDGLYTVYWGFEVTNSAPDLPGHAKASGVEIFGPHTKFINMIVHHTGNGMGVWTPALATELYGNLIFEIGWDDQDRGHGHSLYMQNDSLTKRVVDNILFDGHSFGVHAYTESGHLNNLHFEGNVAFDHGSRSSISGAKANFLIGGRRLASHAVLRSNLGYYPWSSAGRNAEVGYINGCDDALIEDNYFAGGLPLVVTRCTSITVKNNHLAGRLNSAVGSRFPQNTYETDRPTTGRVFTRPNRYVDGQGYIAIFNWDCRSSVRLDVSSLGLEPGETFEVRDVRHYFDAPLLTATYDGRAIDVPLGSAPWDAPTAGLPPEFVTAMVVPRRMVAPGAVPWTRSVRQSSASSAPTQTGGVP